MEEVERADLKALWIPNQTLKKKKALQQETVSGKEPPQSSKGPEFNQTKKKKIL